MENYLTLLFGILVSCFTYTFIAFQFIEERYSRVYTSKILYIILKFSICVGMIGINLLNIPVLNLVSWIAIFGVIVMVLYTYSEKRAFQRFIEITILFLLFAVCETVGYLIFEFTFWKLSIDTLQPMLTECLHMTFSKIIILVCYYGLITRLWKRTECQAFSISQCVTYAIITIYSIANISVIIVVVSNDMATSFGERLLLLINMFCIVFADMFLLFFTKFTEENNCLKRRLSLIEQQSNLQYEYYLQQEDKYNESIKILHDVHKHLRMIEEIYKANEKNEATIYAKEIEKMLEPLVVKRYINNPILNILLNDKIKYAMMHNIKFDIDIGNIELDFMEPVEITTVFGNLLDNAIEACDLVAEEKHISLKLDSYNDFICLQLKNSMKGHLKWIAGRPSSQKGSNHGIGLLNVESIVKKYNGNMILEQKNNEFLCSVIFNE